MRPDRERGAALLTVLLLVAVIAVLAATALERLRLGTRLGGNAIAQGQARGYAMAAETLATMRITDILAREPDRVTLAGGWSGRPIPLPVPGASVVARVTDGGNCFNLNGLATQTAPGVFASYTPARLQFARLIRLVGGRIASPDAVAAAASDWVDSDNAPVAGGAEDDAYAGLPVPYRPPNTPMADVSELRAVQGVTPDLYRALRPWVCALPVARPAQINVNTLTPEQAPLIAMLADGINGDAVRGVLSARPAQGWGSNVDFWAQPALAGARDSGASAGTAVVTHWFDLAVDVALNGTELHETGVIDANRLPARLVSRQWGEGT